MKLGVVTTSFPRAAGDAAGHFVASHVELLRRAGHAVEVIAAGDGVAPGHERRAAGERGLAATSLHAASARRAGARSTNLAGALDDDACGPLEITRLASELFFTGGAPEALEASFARRAGHGGADAPRAAHAAAARAALAADAPRAAHVAAARAALAADAPRAAHVAAARAALAADAPRAAHADAARAAHVAAARAALAAGYAALRATTAAAGYTARLAAAVARQSRAWDATVAHWLAPSALAALVAPGPLLAVAHGGDVHLLRRAGLLAPTLAALLARRARLVFVSHELAALARAALPAPLRLPFDAATLVQPMGVDVAHFAAASSRHARPHPRRYLLVLGRLAQVKGVDLALEAFAVLRELAARPGSAGDDAPGAPPDAARELAPTAPPAAPDVPAAPAAPAAPADRDARAALIAGDGPERARLQQLADLDLVIAGDGPERPRLQQLAAALPAATAARVRFLGELPAAARDAWLAHAAAVVLPSRRLAGGRGEGTPQVALEALAAGVPLLAAATGGLAALPAPARLLPEAERDPRRWAAALLELLAAASPISADAARAAVAPFDWPDVAAALHAHWLGAR